MAMSKQQLVALMEAMAMADHVPFCTAYTFSEVVLKPSSEFVSSGLDLQLLAKLRSNVKANL